MSQEFAKKQDLPRLEHVLLPRIGALDVVMKVLGPDTDLAEEDKIQRIVDVTIAYPEGKPLDIPTVVLGWRNPCKTHLHFRSWDVKVRQMANTIYTLSNYYILFFSNVSRIFLKTQKNCSIGW